MRKITKIRRSIRAISPVISVLLMIAIAVAAALVAFAWVSGYLDSTTTKVGKSIQIQSISQTAVYVQNVGEGDVELKSLYVNGALATDAVFTPEILAESATSTVTTVNWAWAGTSKVTIKIVTTDGISAQMTKTFTSSSPSAVTYTISASAGSGGSITPSGAVTVTEGADMTFTITSGTGFHIVDVLVDSVSQGPITSYPFTDVTTDHTISATFAVDTFTITASAGTGGSIDPSGAVDIDYGNDQTFDIAADSGFHILDVLVDGGSVGAVTSYPFTNVQADHTISATFESDGPITYTITVTAGTHGEFVPAGPSVTVLAGADQPFTITPSTGYHVATLLVDGSSVTPDTSYTFTDVTADHTISATFSINKYTITASAGTGGSIAPSGAVDIDYGDDQTFTIAADTGYHIADVLVDGSSVTPDTSYTFTDVTADHTIEATFAINTYTITASAGTGGTIDPSGAVSVDYGADQTFTITPSTGYHVATLLIDGGSVTPATSYTFNDVTADHTISVTFATSTQTLTLRPTGSGSTDNLRNNYSWPDFWNWQFVDDDVLDNEATYVYDSRDDDGYNTDLYQTANHGSETGTITSVTVYIICRSDGYSSDTSYARTAIRIGGTTYYGTQTSLSGSWTEISTPYSTNPHGGSWTWSDIDALEVGVSLDSGDTSGGNQNVAWCTQVYVVVTYTP